VLLIPDKDADGLCAAGIVVKTLQLLGCPGEGSSSAQQSRQPCSPRTLHADRTLHEQSAG
jgi:hypothetical protein